MSSNQIQVTTHRIYFKVPSLTAWYNIIKEARTLYGKNWRGQSRVRKFLPQHTELEQPMSVWFEIPDPNFGTWIAVKYGIMTVNKKHKLSRS